MVVFIDHGSWLTQNSRASTRFVMLQTWSGVRFFCVARAHTHSNSYSFWLLMLVDAAGLYCVFTASHHSIYARLSQFYFVTFCTYFTSNAFFSTSFLYDMPVTHNFCCCSTMQLCSHLFTFPSFILRNFTRCRFFSFGGVPGFIVSCVFFRRCYCPVESFVFQSILVQCIFFCLLLFCRLFFSHSLFFDSQSKTQNTKSQLNTVNIICVILFPKVPRHISYLRSQSCFFLFCCSCR